MAVPKRRISRSRRGNRRAHNAKPALQLVACSHCGTNIRPHHICPQCGHYRGKQVTVGASA
ncbi:MAG: 50S ribosomal protein L32 [Planctomycetes bacterium]|nr:50S ribosomal protein L32 [Planctomycetota bacterium]